jgi:4,5-DOPA dioxygenase extradiol
MTQKMPAIFLSHGSPMLALEDEATTIFLRGLSAQFSKPTAIIVASAHWETDVPMVTASPNPETIHDFYGFPAELYKLRYTAPGNPELAERIQKLLGQAGIDYERGLDHGVWDPLIVMYPQADIPVIEISVQPGRDAAWHYQLGQKLAALRGENILVIGSGNLTHNLREAFRGHHPETPSWVTEFAEWVDEKLKANDIDSLLKWQDAAPHALKNHPTPEHFLPFFVALGAAGNYSKAQRLNREVAMGVLAMDVYRFD